MQRACDFPQPCTRLFFNSKILNSKLKYDFKIRFIFFWLKIVDITKNNTIDPFNLIKTPPMNTQKTGYFANNKKLLTKFYQLF